MFAHLSPQSPCVVVTGLGAITSLGPTATDLWAGVKAGQVGIGPVQSLAMDAYQTRLGGEVRDRVFPRTNYRHPECWREPAIDFALKAAEEALANCGLTFAEVPAERWGVVLGSCMGGGPSAQRWYADIVFDKAPIPEMPLLFPPQALAEAVSSAYGIKGPVLSVATACAAGGNAIGYAAALIRAGHADVVLAGGSDAFADILFAGFNSLESLSPEPAAPYSLNRQGLSLGEGSGMLVLVRADLATQAEASILAEVLGYGLSADGYHPTAPHPEGKGASRAIAAALATAGISPEQVRYVNGHGTGTAKNDPAETRAIRLTLGPAAAQVALSSTKSMIGHLLGAAGAVEGIVTIKALQEQIAPPTANYAGPDPDCPLDCVPNVGRSLTMDVAISNNFAFGGHNTCVVLGRPGAGIAPPPSLPREPVVVTGIATLTSAGCDPDKVWHAFSADEICTQLDQGVQVGWVQGFDPAQYLSGRERRRMDRLGLFSVIAARLALTDAGLEVTDKNRNQLGVLFGTGLGPTESWEKFLRPILEEGPQAANPGIFPNTVFNAAAGLVSIHTGAVGPASTVTTGHAAGASALSYGYDLVAAGQADAMVCLAADALTDTVIRGYRELELLTTEAATPFIGRGFALAEAGVALVLERLSVARARAARIYGQVLGYGIASDAKGVGRFDPRGLGLEQAMRLALGHADLHTAAVSTVWASAAGNRLADRAELAAIRRLFSDRPPTILTPKARFGEPIGAGGLLNAALALKAWQQGDYYEAPTQAVLVNSCSFGGTHFSIALGTA